jgi:hypothetical protein
MATDVRVKVTDATIISALNTPGGAVHVWRNETERDLLELCYRTSPVNNPANAMHRGGLVGVYKASWVTRRRGNQHRVGFAIENVSDHAIFVEEGRSASSGTEAFSTEDRARTIVVPGSAARPGRHILRDATNRILMRATGGAYTPLV